MVTAVAIAKKLGVSPKTLRNWLRKQATAGHALVAAHTRYERWVFTNEEAEHLESQYRRSVSPDQRATRIADRPQPGQPPHTDDPGNRVEEEWMGQRVDTLRDLLRPHLKAVVVGVNPALKSVRLGHYYKGRAGQRVWSFLRSRALMPAGFDGHEDDAAFAAGVGFTDLVKRPTGSASDLLPGEAEHGQPLLAEKLARCEFGVAILVFKKFRTLRRAAIPADFEILEI